MVIRYAYLWWADRRRGAVEARKDRPCAVILAVRRDGERSDVIVAPITHTPPQVAGTALEIPVQVKRRIGLDDRPSWIVLTEINRFRWPGPDLRPIPGVDPPRYVYGFLPARLLTSIRQDILQRIQAKRLLNVKRDE